MGVKLDYEHWCDHVPKISRNNREGKFTTLWNQQVK